ncbi:MAG: hypothetical protein U0X40_05305 [Ferruginibacter sp.]
MVQWQVRAAGIIMMHRGGFPPVWMTGSRLLRALSSLIPTAYYTIVNHLTGVRNPFNQILYNRHAPVLYRYFTNQAYLLNTRAPAVLTKTYLNTTTSLSFYFDSVVNGLPYNMRSITGPPADTGVISFSYY